MKKSPQWKGRTHGGALGQKGLFFFFKYMNLSLGYAILSVVIVFYMIFSRTGFKSIWFYFRKIQGNGVVKSLINTYKNHYLFGQTLLDKFALFAGKKQTFKMSITGQKYFDEIINSSKGAIIASSHVGNFEISGYLLRQTQKRINGIVYGGENPVIQQYRERILNEKNVFQIPIADDMSHIFTINNVLSQGEILSMPCDRVYTGNKITSLKFMGQMARFPTGAYHLAVKFQVPVLTLFVMKESAKSYHIFISRIDSYSSDDLSVMQKVDELARNYVAGLETILKEYPRQWFNFYKFWN
ncbi:MAG: lipid A biosynthesis (KDO)2-(lauroyl)-lipid IVA acyltransferase [Bacteroidia bacterium]|nr:lipid A biosynthesis (KDO)2-(lauroyl)-lipid IVA acyltransferase [Bacteroidia bacterium]